MTTVVIISPQQQARKEHRAMLLWTCVVVGLLTLGIGTSIGGAFLALRSKPMIEDSYYNRALHWDDHAALVQASRELGWKTQLTVGEAVTSTGEKGLILYVTDRTGAPLDHATVTIAYFHRAHPLEMRQTELKFIEGGIYAASTPLAHAGIWEFRLTIKRTGGDAREEMYIESLQRELP
jgi:nitrogen fixation protein FixH